MSSKQLALAAYRALLRSCKDQAATAEREGVGRVILRQPIDKDGWKQGKFRTYPPGTDLEQEAVKSLFPTLAQVPVSSSLTLSTLQDCVRINFRTGGSAEGEEASKLLDQALEALRILAEQSFMAECSSSSSSDNVSVEATSSFLGKVPDDMLAQEQARWLWTYRCRVQNRGQEPLILWGRHWIILDGSSSVVAEVPYGSQGVIGQQPLLEPGSTFEYYSGAELESPSGSMQGAFQCVTLNASGLPEQPIEARIRPFKLLSSKEAAP